MSGDDELKLHHRFFCQNIYNFIPKMFADATKDEQKLLINNL
jgi:predicted secreted protein